MGITGLRRWAKIRRCGHCLTIIEAGSDGLIRSKPMLALFLLPGLLGLLIFFAVPFFGGIYYSLTDGTVQNNYVGMANYFAVWNNEMFRLGLKNTLELSVLSAPMIFVLSFVVAVMLRALKNGSTLFRNVLLLPYLMPTAAMILIWLLLFDYGGAINKLLDLMGYARITWKEGDALRVPVLILYVWKNLGFSVVIFTAALQAVPEALYEYARLEGASAWTREVRITLPLISPTAFLVFVLAWINAFKIFKEVYIIGGAHPSMSVYTLQHFMNNHFARINYQYVTTAAYSFAAVALVLFAALYLLEMRMRKGVGA